MGARAFGVSFLTCRDGEAVMAGVVVEVVVVVAAAVVVAGVAVGEEGLLSSLLLVLGRLASGELGSEGGG